MGVATAVIVSAVIGAVASKRAADKQEAATQEASQRTEDARIAEQDRLAQIASETKPTELTAEGISFGTGDTNAEVGSSGDFLIPKTSALGVGGVGGSGLGFAL